MPDYKFRTIYFRFLYISTHFMVPIYTIRTVSIVATNIVQSVWGPCTTDIYFFLTQANVCSGLVSGFLSWDNALAWVLPILWLCHHFTDLFVYLHLAPIMGKKHVKTTAAPLSFLAKKCTLLLSWNSTVKTHPNCYTNLQGRLGM